MPSKTTKGTKKPTKSAIKSTAAASKRGLSARVLLSTQTPRQTRGSCNNTPSAQEVISMQHFDKESAVGDTQMPQLLPVIDEDEGINQWGPEVGRAQRHSAVPPRSHSHRQGIDSSDEVEEYDDEPDLYETASEDGGDKNGQHGRKLAAAGTRLHPVSIESSQASDSFSDIEDVLYQRQTSGRNNSTHQISTIHRSVWFKIRIWFILPGREIDVDVKSTDNFISVRRALATAIEHDVRDLQPFRYKIEKNRDQTAYRDLETQEDWVKIVEWGQKYRTGQMKRKNGTPDDWSVKVKEVSEGKAGSKGSKPHKKKEENAGAGIDAPRLKASADLAHARQCNQHGNKLCWIPCGSDIMAFEGYGLSVKHNDHIQITDAEIEMWIDELLQKNATHRSPGIMVARQIARRCAQNAARKSELTQPNPVHKNTLLPEETPRFSHTFRTVGAPTPGRFPARSHSVPAPGAPLASNNTSNVVTGVKKHYPPVKEWLPSLNGRLDGDKKDYSAYLEAFLEENIQSTFEIIYMGKEGLQGVGGIGKGTAARIHAWAVEDSK